MLHTCPVLGFILSVSGESRLPGRERPHGKAGPAGENAEVQMGPWAIVCHPQRPPSPACLAMPFQQAREAPSWYLMCWKG